MPLTLQNRRLQALRGDLGTVRSGGFEPPAFGTGIIAAFEAKLFEGNKL